MDLVELALRAALHPAWLAGCETCLTESVPGFHQKPRQEQLKLLLQQCLHSDLNLCGAGTLPPGVQDLHATQLAGRFLLQLDEVVNIGTQAKLRFSKEGSGTRCLKLLMTDGVQQVVGLEYQHIPKLTPFMPAGTKVLVYDPAVRRGMLLLTPANLMVLGGQVERLEQARQRVLEHWNQPAVGRRGPPAQLGEAIRQATAAAWGGGGGGGEQPQQQQQQQPQWQAPGPPQPQQPRQAMHLPPPPQQAQPQGPQQPLQQQQQHAPPGPLRQPQAAQQQSYPANSGGGQSVSFGSVPPRPRLQLRRSAGGASGSESFSFAAQQNESQQHSESISLQGGIAGAVQQQQQQASSSLPLQPANRDNAAAAGNAKRSRLQLRQPTNAGDFSFVQPGSDAQQPQQQPMVAPGPGGPKQGQQAPGAAGTDDDPICILSQEDQLAGPRAGASAMQVDPPQHQQQQPDDLGYWSDSWNDDWDQPPNVGPRLEPFEVGYDEQPEGGSGGLDPGNGSAAELEGPVAEGKEDWEEEEEEEGWEDEAVGQQQEQEQEEVDAGEEGTTLEAPAERPAAAAGGPLAGEAAADIAMLDADGDAVHAVPPTAKVAATAAEGPAAQQALAAQPAAGGSLGAAQVPPAPPPVSHQQPGAHVGAHSSQDGVAGLGTARLGAAGRKRQVLESDDDEDTDGLAAAFSSPPEPNPAMPQDAAAAGSALVAAAAAAASGAAELRLAPLDDSLLKPAPSLVDLMSRPTPGSAAGHACGAAAPQSAPLQLPSLPAPPPAPMPVAAAAATGPGMLRSSGGKAPGGSGGALHRVSGGVRPLQLRPNLRMGSAAPPAAAPRLAQALAAPPSPLAAMVCDSDDDVPVFDGLVEEDMAAAGAGGSSVCGCSEDEPFTYLYLLAQRAKSTGAAGFPITANIFGVVKTMVGKLKYENPETGEPEYNVEMLVEDGSMVCRARLGNQFLREFFDCPSQEFKRRLAGTATKAEALQLVQALQRYLADYSGLMRVRLAVPGAVLETVDLGGGLTPAQAAVLQARAMS